MQWKKVCSVTRIRFKTFVKHIKHIKIVCLKFDRLTQQDEIIFKSSSTTFTEEGGAKSKRHNQVKLVQIPDTQQCNNGQLSEGRGVEHKRFEYHARAMLCPSLVIIRN